MSHFSFTRSNADDCALKKKNQESIAPFKWATDSEIVESKQSCYLGASPFMHTPFRSVPSKVVDIESDLKGQTKNLTKCISCNHSPDKDIIVESDIKECKDEKLIPEYTRTKRPCNVLSGITINRFDPLCEDPQSFLRIHSNSYAGRNTRLQIKDTFKLKAEAKKSGRDALNFKHDTKTYCGKCAYLIYQ